MQKLSEITNALASSIVLADPSDLPALAEIHSQFEALAALVNSEHKSDAPEYDNLQKAAVGAGGLVEDIILKDVKDESASWKNVGDTIAVLQELIEYLADGREDKGVAFPSYLGLDGGRKPEEDLAEVEGMAAKEAASETPSDPAATEASPETEEKASASTHPDLTESPILDDDVPMIVEFVDEANTHLETAESEILKLEDDPEDKEVINTIFRAFHTIKGVAGFLNLKQIGALAHAAENMLDLARKGELVLTSGSIDVILESIDLMKELFVSLADSVQNNVTPPTNAGLLALIDRIGICASGDAPEPKVGELLVERGVVSEDDVEEAVDEQAAGDERKVGEILVDEKKAAPKEIVSALREQKGSEKPKPVRAPSESTVKVNTARLDSLINMVGELVIAQAMVNQDVEKMAESNQRLDRNMNHMEKITRELQDLSMSMRMVPIQGVFQKMARLVRDLSRKAGKDIDFVVTGGETELDRNLVEIVADPLVHMVRNSVDHGVEMPDEREANGKPRQGTVELKAYHKGGSVVVEIIDDGKGLNKEKILKKAISQGIVKEGQEMSEQEIYRLIFHAGLSTAEKITDVSGRGVGMDVVRKNIESLRGRIDIQSAVNEGSTFSISLPLTLAVIDGLVVRVGDQRYIIPITSIEQSIQPKPEQISTVQGRGEMQMVRDRLLPLVRLYNLLDIKPDSENPCEALTVIVQDNDRFCCIMVDELLGQQQVVIKALGDGIGSVPGVSGGAILGDGNVSLILDVPGLIDLGTNV